MDRGSSGATIRDFRPGDEAAIRAVMDAAYLVDHMPGWTRAEIDVEISRIPVDPEETLVALDDGVIVGYWNRRYSALRVHPGHRRRGHGRQLFEAALARSAHLGDTVITLHVPTDIDASVAFAQAVGLVYRSTLWQFRLRAGRPVPEPEIPRDIVLRHWTDDIDVEAFVAFCTAAWAGHPSPLGLTPDLARLVAQLPGFDPGGICLVSRAAEPDRPIGFAKVEIRTEDAGPPMGWIGQIGVLPSERGLGLGRMLLEWSVAYLRARGAADIDLAVEAENELALGLYRRTGFEPVIAWQHWVRPVDEAPATMPAAAGPGAGTAQRKAATS